MATSQAPPTGPGAQDHDANPAGVESARRACGRAGWLVVAVAEAEEGVGGVEGHVAAAVLDGSGEGGEVERQPSQGRGFPEDHVHARLTAAAVGVLVLVDKRSL
jgi:hypothetical protein